MIFILYDGQCGLCHRAIRTLRHLDWLKRLRYIDYQNETDRRAVAPEIPYETLDRSMHAKWDDGRVKHGFAAFRAIAWSLPPLWIIAPFLYVPGISHAGDAIYKHVAAKRKGCAHESCNR